MFRDITGLQDLPCSLVVLFLYETEKSQTKNTPRSRRICRKTSVESQKTTKGCRLFKPHRIDPGQQPKSHYALEQYFER